MSLKFVLPLALAAFGFAAPAPAAEPDWAAIGQALGKVGTVMPGGVYRVGLPRTDLQVTLDGVALKAGFALGGWVAFELMGDRAMVMGDLVLTETEIGPVMQKMAQEGIAITALHNHLLRASPPTFYMHVLGQGDPVKLAQALHDGLALSATPFPVAPASSAVSAAPDLDVAAID